MNRTGKIARLPRALREQINQRLQNSESSTALLAWLNPLPEVQAILEEQFAGLPISRQNLSDWRQGGYVAWEFKRDLRDDARETIADSAELDPANNPCLADHLSTILTARYASLVRHWDGEVTAKLLARLKVLRGMIQDIAHVRRWDHSVAKVHLAVAKTKPAPRPVAPVKPNHPDSWADEDGWENEDYFPDPPLRPSSPAAAPRPSPVNSFPTIPDPRPETPDPIPPSSLVKPGQGTLTDPVKPSPNPANPSEPVIHQKVNPTPDPKPPTPDPKLRTSYDVWPEHVADELNAYTIQRLPPQARPPNEVMPSTIYDPQRGTFAILVDPDQPKYPGSLRWGKGLEPEMRPYRPTLCQGKCNLANGHCTGCQRTEEEITLWPVLNRPERVAYIHKILTRRLASGLIK